MTEEIIGLCKRELGLDLERFDGGGERENLSFSVLAVRKPEKLERCHLLLADALPRLDSGSAVVFCATQKGSEAAALQLRERGWKADAYHGGMDSSLRRSTQDDFIADRLQVICATSAFGMGVDKPNVRLVVHTDIPGSLESYLQQAGRAGRDGLPARCVLLFLESDVDAQFRLSARDELRLPDLQALWRAVKAVSIRKEGADELRVVSPQELLRFDALAGHIDPDDPLAQTRVTTGLSWLERGKFLQRDENQTQVFQGRPKVRSLAEAAARLDELGLKGPVRETWTRVLRRLLDAPADEGMDATALGLLAATVAGVEMSPIDATRELFRVLREMVEARLITTGLELSAFLRHKVTDPSHQRLEAALHLDEALFALLPELAPEAEEQWTLASPARLCAAESLQTLDPRPEQITRALRALREDGLGWDKAPASADLVRAGPDGLRIKLRRSWTEICRIRSRRRAAAQVVFETIVARIPPGESPSKEVLVAFSLEELANALDQRRLVLPDMKTATGVAENALLYLHGERIITLQGGLAVFRPAMTLRSHPDDRPKKVTKLHHQPLEDHYKQRKVQIHVMHRFAEEGVSDVGRALGLARDWFTLEQRPFLQRWFPGQRRLVEMATTIEGYRRIVDELGSEEQQEIVTAPPDENLLVLAGPGSGKTRVLVHRVAWLLRVKRVRSEGIIVVCYTRANAMELKRRLRLLVGEDARRVTVQTLHGVALQLVGRPPERSLNGKPGEPERR